MNDARIIEVTRRWLERAVIGLNLCPFAKGVHAGGRIRFSVSPARTADALLADLQRELRLLQAADPQQVETTLLIHPHVLADFLDYNDFLDAADDALDALDLADQIQIASFHPQYRFAGTAADDMANCTNRSPLPLLHLLRQASVQRALAGYADPAAIFEANIVTMRRLGHAGWRKVLAADGEAEGDAKGAAPGT